MGDDRFDVWQDGRPYTLAGWATHDYGGGGKLDVDYFLAGGLNTTMDNRCSYGSKRPMADVGDLPMVYLVYADNRPDLDGFIADFEKARSNYSNIVALMLGDEVRSVYGGDGFKHMRQIRDWVVNHPDPKVRSLLLMTCTPGGGLMSTRQHVRDDMNITADRIQPDAVVTQMYKLYRSDVSPEYYASMQWFANWCRQRGISMWVVGRTWSSSKAGVPSESVLRLQKFVNLSYGVQGMFDFLWPAGAAPTVRHAGYWNFDGKDNVRRFRSMVVWSSDQGRSWREPITFPLPRDGNVGLTEATLVQLGPGDYLAAIRGDEWPTTPDAFDGFYLSRSTDGENWTTPSSLGERGRMPLFYQIGDRWALSYRLYDRVRSTQRGAVRFSRDGKRWTTPIIIESGVDAGPQLVRIADTLIAFNQLFPNRHIGTRSIVTIPPWVDRQLGTIR